MHCRLTAPFVLGQAVVHSFNMTRSHSKWYAEVDMLDRGKGYVSGTLRPEVVKTLGNGVYNTLTCLHVETSFKQISLF